jgi:hypothetical protein
MDGLQVIAKLVALDAPPRFVVMLSKRRQPNYTSSQPSFLRFILIYTI